MWTIETPWFDETDRSGADRDPTSHTRYLVGQIIQTGLQIEALMETPLNTDTVKEAHTDPARA